MSKRRRALSLPMAEQGPWDPADDAYNERVSPAEGGDPSPNTTLSLERDHKTIHPIQHITEGFFKILTSHALLPIY